MLYVQILAHLFSSNIAVAPQTIRNLRVAKPVHDLDDIELPENVRLVLSQHGHGMAHWLAGLHIIHPPRQPFLARCEALPSRTWRTPSQVTSSTSS
jgi:hypothetical protein